MKAARQVLERLEAALRNAVEGVGRLLPGKLQPLELAAELTHAMERSQTLTSDATYVANRYRVLLAPGDLELFGGLRDELETELARRLREHTDARQWQCGPRLSVRLEAEPTMPTGRVRVVSDFHGDAVPARLRVIAGQEPRSFDIRGEALIGRTSTCAIQIEEPAVSRQHARLEWTYPGYLLTDLGSSNGTFVNGQPVTQHLLREGDVVEVGLVQLQFSYLPD